MRDTLENVQNDEAIRALFRNAFLDKDQPQLLALMLDRLGYFADKPEAIKPELQAVGNWILEQCGILHTLSPEFAGIQAQAFAVAIARTASDADLVARKVAINKGEKPDK